MSKKNKKLSNKKYEKELFKLQVELCKLQEWVKAEGKRIIIVFEGRDTAGKGGIIKRILERVSPRVFKVNALPTPTDRQKTQMYFQRYIECFPAAGEIAIFDRSWYNRAGVERVMGFCTDEEYHTFLKMVPEVENAIIEDGIILIKYWLDVDKEIQNKRLNDRVNDPRKHWKLSPMDLQAQVLWDKYTEAKELMFEASDKKDTPWFVVNSNNKKSARLNCITHLLEQIPYEEIPYAKPIIQKSQKSHYKSKTHDYKKVAEKF